MFVWGVWAALSLTVLAYVWLFGSNVPLWDDWDMVPTMTGHQPVTIGWLWSQHNEHRIPLPRLIMLALYRGFRDVRSGMYFNVICMSALAALLIDLSRRLRGWLSAADAFFPLVILSLGQGTNFLWGWQVEFFTSTALAIAALWIICRDPRMQPRSIAGLTLVLALLVGSGAHGVALAPALVACLVGVAVASRKTTGKRAIFAAASALIGIGLAALYMHGYQPVPHHPTSAGLRASVKTVLQAMTMSFGPAARYAWPWLMFFVVALLLATAALLIIVLRRQPEERIRAWGMGCWLGGLVCLAMALGLGRNGFEPRYVTLLFPLLCGLFLIWTHFGPRRIGAVIQYSLLLASAVLLAGNTRAGLVTASDVRTQLLNVENDIRRGEYPSKIIAWHYVFLHPSQVLLNDYFPMLRNARIGAFAQLANDPDFREIDISQRDLKLTRAVWDGNAMVHEWNGTADVILPQPIVVAGVRISYHYANDLDRQPLFVMTLAPSADINEDSKFCLRSFPTGDRANWEHGDYPRIGQTQSMAFFWLWQRVDRLHIIPDYIPGRITFDRIELLTPKQ